ncbi:LOW QUALITY PROTEIN: phospholipase A1 1 [Drosophila gunungcola]|uniref:LOW QUALITY PROTEIN: phospholipase A1 1 n=1 Tax=Drosophila gunungcola TaxID=103775 RepID=UPI0022E986C8|nr:LOW QUALITY PROTEIN: phospholipase A1 1 [Drosophila gunungcola]
MRILCLIVILLRFGSSEDTAENVEGRATGSWWDALPRLLTDIVNTKVNILTAAPLELVANAIDTVCSSTLFMGRVPPKITPDIQKMHFQYMTPCQNYSVPLLEASKLWKHSRFSKGRKVVILATGWTNTVNESSAILMISKAFMCRGDVNFVIVDAADYVDTLYSWSALNTDLIGEHIGVGLTHLIELTPLRNIHLIGHSLGAHIMGTAGRTFKRLTGKLIPRITGLDPAKPCFRRENILPGLTQGDAKLVDIIHTNIGILAKRGPLGDVDFYPGGAHPIQPGCLTIGCSHTRAVEYFAESAYPQQKNNFMGRKCASWDKLRRRDCSEGIVSPMGYQINPQARGMYYVDVNGWPPYGRNAQKSIDPSLRTCYLCQT